MGILDLIVKPPIKRAAIEAVTLIGAGGYEAIFINLPRSLQPFIWRLTEHGDVEGFIREAEHSIGLGESYLSALVRGHEYFLRHLPKISQGLEIICYSTNPTEADICITFELPSLILRDSIIEDISLDRWLELIKEMRGSAEKALREEAEFLVEHAGRLGLSACICNPEAAADLRRLLQTRITSRIIYTALPYCFTPLQTLLRIYSRKPPHPSEVEKYLKQHIRFVQQYIIKLGLDEGLEAWTRKELGWLIKGYYSPLPSSET
ncbi:MAG: hypothetical protein QXF51_00715 [Nitrososphaerota archaeon]